jgi:hypothetical protein
LEEQRPSSTGKQQLESKVRKCANPNRARKVAQIRTQSLEDKRIGRDLWLGKKRNIKPQCFKEKETVMCTFLIETTYAHIPYPSVAHQSRNTRRQITRTCTERATRWQAQLWKEHQLVMWQAFAGEQQCRDDWIGLLNWVKKLQISGKDATKFEFTLISQAYLNKREDVFLICSDRVDDSIPPPSSGFKKKILIFSFLFLNYYCTRGTL